MAKRELNEAHHFIFRLRFDLSIEKRERSHAIQLAISDLMRHKLHEELEELIQQTVPQHVNISIPRLEIDVGKIEEKKLAEELPPRIVDALRKALLKYRLRLASPSTLPHEKPAPQDTSSSSYRQQLLFFLEMGYFKGELPQDDFSLDDTMAELISESPSYLKSYLLSISNKKSLSKRLATQFEPQLSAQIMRPLAGAYADFVLAKTRQFIAHQNLAPKAQQETSQQIWEMIFYYLLHRGAQSFNRDTFDALFVNFAEGSQKEEDWDLEASGDTRSKTRNESVEEQLSATQVSSTTSDEEAEEPSWQELAINPSLAFSPLSEDWSLTFRRLHVEKWKNLLSTQQTSYIGFIRSCEEVFSKWGGTQAQQLQLIFWQVTAHFLLKHTNNFSIEKYLLYLLKYMPEAFRETPLTFFTEILKLSQESQKQERGRFLVLVHSLSALQSKFESKINEEERIEPGAIAESDQNRIEPTDLSHPKEEAAELTEPQASPSPDASMRETERKSETESQLETDSLPSLDIEAEKEQLRPLKAQPSNSDPESKHEQKGHDKDVRKEVPPPPQTEEEVHRNSIESANKSADAEPENSLPQSQQISPESKIVEEKASKEGETQPEDSRASRQISASEEALQNRKADQPDIKQNDPKRRRQESVSKKPKRSFRKERFTAEQKKEELKKWSQFSFEAFTAAFPSWKDQQAFLVIYEDFLNFLQPSEDNSARQHEEIMRAFDVLFKQEDRRQLVAFFRALLGSQKSRRYLTEKLPEEKQLQFALLWGESNRNEALVRLWEELKVHFPTSWLFNLLLLEIERKGILPSIPEIMANWIKHLVRMRRKSHVELLGNINSIFDSTDILTAEEKKSWTQLAQALEHRFALTPKKVSPPLFPRKKSAPNPQNPIYVNNAGLVLIWPFLPFYFKSLKLLSPEQKFVDQRAAKRAVKLLQYLATGHTEAGEAFLVLNKILCGVPLNQATDKQFELSPEEQKWSEELLKAVGKRWEKISSASIDSIRGNWLIREGKLSPREGDWVLKVNQKPWDLLLKTLPWGLSVIRFPWMPYQVYIEWA